ncbi:MAG: pyruvate:ferredoxin (flavodoxin) oxidoreductase, partial [Candidatus Lindowbacteria bacterium]|nr:pyruvate:ferredoxin (flavodoxin) oxidoreductase [Candidatus Lindowbacteria bacterium]
MAGQMVTIDGNEAAAYIAHKTNEVVSIYPITPSSGMGELCDEWSAKGYTNIWGAIPNVIEMQSEGGAAGSVHGALQAGSLTTTFTASQGLLLMIPNMYKIAGELTPTVFHVAARSIAAQALSIFGDHSDVMAARTTGWAMLFSGSVQEAMDLALISQAATLETRIPFLHAFDGFRTSHEVMKIERVSDDVIRKMINSHFVRSLRKRALSPDHPVIRGTAQNPDAFFQARETVNPYYDSAPFVVQNTMDRFAELTGRQYRLFDYVGAEDADRVIVMMGSGAEAAEETVNYLIEEGEKVGVLKIRLFRPFAVNLFINSLPETVRSIAVLDRTKEPGAIGEPLYQDVVTAISESMLGNKQRFETPPIVVGGRYGLSSKEFTPAMVAAIFNTLNKKRIKNHFTIGIHDDVTKTSIPFDPSFSVEDPETVKGIFWGLGSDGTVGANKNSIKIIGEGTDNFAQGYFVYDSKKAGAITVSHLRFGPKPIKSTYLVSEANFVGVHQFQFLDKYNVLEQAAHGACFILNSPYPVDEIWDNIPRNLQNEIISKKIRFYIINAYDVAQKAGMGARINTIMQTCFFALSGVLPRVEVIDRIKKSIKKTYSKKGKALVEKNYAAVDATLANLAEVKIPKFVSSTIELKSLIPDFAPKFVQNVTGVLMSGRGNDLPVSAFPDDGTYPTGTAKWEKRAVSTDVPVWKSETCIQCGKCILVCPHACLRAKTYSPNRLDKAPTTFKSADAQWKELGDAKYTIQLSIDDCTGCELCVEICPVKDKQQPETKAINMKKAESYRASERDNWDFFTMLPDYTPYSTDLKFDNVRNIQLLKPLFEFSGACAGCGETPYLKLMSQLFGDRSIIANATGCSSIYGGNL